MNNYHILYSFRRCPYAIRSRWALLMSSTRVILREVDLKNKPNLLLDISPKSTVPVLQLTDGSILDESIDIIFWALSHSNLYDKYISDISMTNYLINQNDNQFKYYLDRYKYFTRYNENEYYENKLSAINILIYWNDLLSQDDKGHFWLINSQESVADWAIWPFVRQFRNVNQDEFKSNKNLTNLNNWLNQYVNHIKYSLLMKKFSVWKPNDKIKFFPS